MGCQWVTRQYVLEEWAQLELAQSLGPFKLATRRQVRPRRATNKHAQETVTVSRNIVQSPQRLGAQPAVRDERISRTDCNFIQKNARNVFRTCLFSYVRNMKPVGLWEQHVREARSDRTMGEV